MTRLTKLTSCANASRSTGASSGIGRAIAILFASEGACVVCADIHQYPGSEDGESPGPPSTHQYIQDIGGVGIWYKCDVGLSADVQQVVRVAVEEFGHLDMYAIPSAVITRRSMTW